jgi:hypothetical protein
LRWPDDEVLVGGLCGLAWAAGLRGFMAQVAGSASEVDWAGTPSAFEDGVGGGAIGVSLYGLLGGYALSGRGPRWARIAAGAAALTAIPVWAVTVTSFAGSGLALDTARGAWVAVYYWSFRAVLALACAIPHRAVTPQDAA